MGQFAEVLAAYTLLKDERARRTWDEEQARPGVKMRIPKQYPGMARYWAAVTHRSDLEMIYSSIAYHPSGIRGLRMVGQSPILDSREIV